MPRRKLDREKLQDFFDTDPNAKWAIATTIVVAVSLAAFFILDSTLYQPRKVSAEPPATVRGPK